MKNNLPFLFFLFFSYLINSQTKISGIVLDKKNNPIPFVNIQLKNTKKGTITNSNGTFSIFLSKKRGKLLFSYLGYVSKTKKINSRTKYLTIVLKEEASELDEIIIVSRPKKRLKKKKNPAYKIMKGIWSNKKKNGVQLANYYQYKKIQTVEIELNNLDSSFLKKLLKKDYSSIIKQLPLNENGLKKDIPLYIKETVNVIYGDNKKHIIRKDTEAEKSRGIHKDGFVFDKMAKTFSNINIYKNNIQILKKSFVSPISTTGFETYDYVLHDSIITKKRKLYHIYFFPRRNGDLAFKGHFWVADTIFSITKINMTVHKDINLNFVRKLSFEKEFIIKEDSLYLPKKNIYEGDFTFSDSDNEKGLTIKKTHVYSNYIFNKKLSNNFYINKIIQIKPNQFKKPKSYWNKLPNNTSTKNTYQLIDLLKKKKKIKQITGILTTLSTGYINISPTFQLGQYWNSIVKNSVEGLKIKVGFRTYKSSEDRFRLIGFIGYGIKDKRYKFELETKYLLSYKPRIAFGVRFLYDTEQLGSKLLNAKGFNASIFDPNALFSRGNNFFLSFVNKKTIKLDFAIHNNFHIGFSATHNIIKSASSKKFSINYLNNNGTISSKVTDVSTDFYITYTPGRYVYGFGVEQKIGKNLYPSIVINYHKGYKNIFNGDFGYDKIQFKYSQPILLGKLGILKTSIDAGKTFGKVPITLLSPIPANQTFWITKNTFSLMNYYDFVTDTYISGHFEHHFNGLILNKIPLLKKLKLRSLLTYKMAYGTISDQNKAINKSNITYAAPTDKLYYEYGFGFENIGYEDIRPFRIDFIWRGNHTSINGLSSPKSAIRIGIKIGF